MKNDKTEKVKEQKQDQITKESKVNGAHFYTETQKQNVIKFSKIAAITATAIVVITFILCLAVLGIEEGWLAIEGLLALTIPFYVPLAVICWINTVKAKRKYHITNIVFSSLFLVGYIFFILVAIQTF